MRAGVIVRARRRDGGAAVLLAQESDPQNGNQGEHEKPGKHLFQDSSSHTPVGGEVRPECAQKNEMGNENGN